MIDGFKRDLISDEQFVKMLQGDLNNGVHINETNKSEYFTTAFFHTLAEIKSEIVECGLSLEKLIAVESAGFLLDNLTGKAQDSTYLNKVLEIVRFVESNEDILAMSPHILAVAKKS